MMEPKLFPDKRPAKNGKYLTYRDYSVGWSIGYWYEDHWYKNYGQAKNAQREIDDHVFAWLPMLPNAKRDGDWNISGWFDWKE